MGPASEDNMFTEYRNEKYCGRCHTFTELEPRGILVTCECPPGALHDFSKDPNCKNSLHEHHDPLSPIVISQRRMDEAELAREAEATEVKVTYLDIDDDEEVICLVCGRDTP